MNIHAFVVKLEHRWEVVGVVVIAFFLVLFLGVILYRRRPRKLNPEEFRKRWQELQKQLASKATWSLAIIDADKLLDEVLKKRRFKGKTMGERLVSAQHDLTDNESVWFGHKLRNKLVHEDYKLRGKNEVKDALLGYLQALKDLGAIKNDKQ